MNGVDIASFAESLVTKQVTQGNPVQFAAPTAPDAPDISHIGVPIDFSQQVLSESFGVKNTAKPKETPPTQPLNEASIYKQHLLNEYENKMQDLEELIDIMESMGMSSGAQSTSGRGGGTPSVGGTKRKVRQRRKGAHKLSS